MYRRPAPLKIHGIGAKLTDDEFEALMDACDYAGVSVASVVRSMVNRWSAVINRSREHVR